ncbi:probable carboxylesterase 120 [Tripterygium wilfordii]|uniref:probable carboxylesterase 120 n=1 Tax=Tripterygium wilfordii TaxID=458696 RepID=UPI0018F82107|nr:probable carboxylesterase 120 [Tripterygium wilfordii]
MDSSSSQNPTDKDNAAQLLNQTLSVHDLYDNLDLTCNPDGSVTRKPSRRPLRSTSPDLSHPTPVLSKDVTINESNHTWARIFLPRHALEEESSSSNAPLPLIVFYCGGGFVKLSAATTVCHDLCFNISSQLSAVVVSLNYRLAPEHRLPAAYDDAVELLYWISNTNDEWLSQHADFTKVFIMGSSSGGNMAYHVGLRVAAAGVDQFKPLKINGLILHYPFFGGAKRSESELRLMNCHVLPPRVSDLLWELSLPIGADRDHEYCNPTVGDGPKLLEKIKSLGWKVLLSTCDGDVAFDRQIEIANMMEEKGIKVERRIVMGDYHGDEALDLPKQQKFIIALKDFIFSSIAQLSN